jgi:hypothetical protein
MDTNNEIKTTTNENLPTKDVKKVEKPTTDATSATTGEQNEKNNEAPATRAEPIIKTEIEGETQPTTGTRGKNENTKDYEKQTKSNEADKRITKSKNDTRKTNKDTNTPKVTTASQKVAELPNSKQRSRYSLTGNFSIEEIETINEIIKQRQAAGITTTVDNFIRQCVDFTINHASQFSKLLQKLPTDYHKGFFAIPNDLEIKPFLQKGFFKK